MLTSVVMASCCWRDGLPWEDFLIPDSQDIPGRGKKILQKQIKPQERHFSYDFLKASCKLGI